MLVPDYHHYVFLMHPMNKLDSSDKFVSAKIDYRLSNIGEKGSERESYKFTFLDKPHNTEIFPPRFRNPNDCFYIVGSSFSNEMQKKMLLSFFPVDSISGMFYVMHSRSSIDKFSSFRHSISIRETSGSKVAILEKEYPSTQKLLGLEDVLYEAIEKGKESDKRVFKEKVFDYEEDCLRTSSFSLITERQTTETLLSVSSQDNTSFFSPIIKFFTPYDITKAGYKFYVFSESIDSVSLTLTFDENIELSPIPQYYITNNSKSITFANVVTKQLDEPKNQFLSNINYKYGQVNMWRYHKCAYRDCISFWVQYESSGIIQWIRLFLLTSILGYLLTNLLSCITSVPENVYKTIKKRKK